MNFYGVGLFLFNKMAREACHRLVKGIVVKNKKAYNNIIYDKTTAETEIVKIEEDIDDYMKREVLPHVPDAVAFFEEVLTEKKTVIKTGADIAFTRYFYQYQKPEDSDVLAQKFIELEESASKRIDGLFR